MEAYAEKIYVLVHRCHEQCLKLMHSNRSFDREQSEIGISTRQGIILKLLLHEDGLTQKEITKRLEITSSSCGELLTKLEQGQYLERRASPADKRTYTVHLTKSGRRLGEYYRQKSIVELEHWASNLTIPEKKELYRLLGKLSEGLDEQIKKAADAG
ncbi:MarR family transcriptional regulator [Treponema sp. OttesenSCG-928-L16]|nr:MarR family transcriptional regulator [Treponema sp. OttesenSCG-928-L16]